MKLKWLIVVAVVVALANAWVWTRPTVERLPPWVAPYTPERKTRWKLKPKPKPMPIPELIVGKVGHDQMKEGKWPPEVAEKINARMEATIKNLKNPKSNSEK